MFFFRSNCACGALACGTAVVKCFGPHRALAQRDIPAQLRSGRPWTLVSMLRWSLVSSSSSGQCSQQDFRKLGGSTKAHSTSPELRDFAGISLARCSVAGRVPTRSGEARVAAGFGGLSRQQWHGIGRLEGQESVGGGRECHWPGRSRACCSSLNPRIFRHRPSGFIRRNHHRPLCSRLQITAR
jgi:hypothetical protein